jgi:predicted lipoprotein
VRRRATALGLLAALAVGAGPACRLATVRPLGDTASPEPGGAAPAGGFDAATFVDSIWQSEVLRALDAATEAGAIAAGTPGAAEGSEGTPRSRAVRGQGRVVDVNTRSRSGTATVVLDGDAHATVVLQIGPVLTGTAIRDALPALGFDRFVNQIQHADVGNELNARVERDVLQPLDRAALRGRRVRFAGMASVENDRPLNVTPVRLEVEP